jgi:hypothetical protein
MIDIKSLYEAMPPELQRKSSIHTLRLTVEKYNATRDPLREAARYAMRRMETIRETNPEIALDADIERLRTALDSENS